MVCTSKDVAGIWVYPDVGDLGVVSASNIDKSAELGGNGAFQGGEHSVCVLVVHGYDIVCVVGRGVAFLMGKDE